MFWTHFLCILHANKSSDYKSTNNKKYLDTRTTTTNKPLFYLTPKITGRPNQIHQTNKTKMPLNKTCGFDQIALSFNIKIQRFINEWLVSLDFFSRLIPVWVMMTIWIKFCIHIT